MEGNHPDRLRSLDTGYVTQRVTDFLNASGGVAVLVWWAALWAERSLGSLRVRRLRLGFLAGATLLLVVLIVLHRVMDARLEAGSLRGFYPLHRAYLVASTAQWFLNLGLLAGSLALWREAPFKSESV